MVLVVRHRCAGCYQPRKTLPMARSLDRSVVSGSAVVQWAMACISDPSQDIARYLSPGASVAPEGHRTDAQPSRG